MKTPIQDDKFLMQLVKVFKSFLLASLLTFLAIGKMDALLFLVVATILIRFVSPHINKED